MTDALARRDHADGGDVAISITRHVRAGLAVLVLLGGGAVSWGLLAPIAGAVIANGVVVVEGSLKRVQHPTGGIVGALHVQEGSHVAGGELLVRLDETATRANLGIIVNELTAHRVHLARLAAEQAGDEDVVFPSDIVERAATEVEVARVIDSERNLFRSEQRNRRGLREQLSERGAQMKQEIIGLEAQRASLLAQGDLAEEERRDVETLYRQKLVQRARVTQLEREVIRITGSVGEMTARIAQTRGRIAEVELQILQIDKEHAAEVAKSIRETETRVGELNERRLAAEDQLRRVEIRAPGPGFVHQLSVHTVGGVVSAGETIMQIVPEGEALVVEFKVSPSDIDQVRIDQDARVRLTGLNPRTTPEIAGRVSRVAADLTRDDKSNLAYYTAAVRISDAELARLNGVTLQPGMPAEVFLRTRERSFAEYIVEPIAERLTRALRED